MSWPVVTLTLLVALTTITTVESDSSINQKLTSQAVYSYFLSRCNKLIEAKTNQQNQQRSQSYEKHILQCMMRMVEQLMLQLRAPGLVANGPTKSAVKTLSKPVLKKNMLSRVQTPKKIPESWDWREHGTVTPIKSQGRCWSGWAFATIANIEGVLAVKKGKLIDLSEQQLLDCDKVNKACLQGKPIDAYKQLLAAGGGLESEKEYPYRAQSQRNCSYSPDRAKAFITGFEVLPQNEDAMVAYLLKNGPIAAYINSFGLLTYKSGILHPSKLICWPRTLDHGVTIVGYGSEKGVPFWVVKNSWGEHWGEEGYFRIYRGDGTCGINLMATSAVVA